MGPCTRGRLRHTTGYVKCAAQHPTVFCETRLVGAGRRRCWRAKSGCRLCCRAMPSWQQWQGTEGRSAHQLLQKATLDGVVFIMRSTGSTCMHIAAATAIRDGTKLKACVMLLGAVVLYLSSALACTWFALRRDSQAHTTAAKEQQPMASWPDAVSHKFAAPQALGAHCWSLAGVLASVQLEQCAGALLMAASSGGLRRRRKCFA